jgi:hypothetical protein
MNKVRYVKRLRADLIRKLNICRPVIDETFGANNCGEFEQYAVGEFDKFADTIPLLKDKNNQFNFSYGPLLLATYRTITLKYGCTEARAIEVVGQIVEYLGRHQIEHMNPVLKLVFMNVGKYSFLRNIIANYFNYEHEPLGWQAVLRRETDAYVAADMTACGLFQWLVLNHTPQLCAIACASDYITVEYMPYLKLERKETIANGDPICSFRYIQKV